MDVNLVSEGLKFMVLGMATVFLFLIVMITVLKIQTKIIAKYVVVKPSKKSESSSGFSSGTDDEAEVIAAITAAIKEHRK